MIDNIVYANAIREEQKEKKNCNACEKNINTIDTLRDISSEKKEQGFLIHLRILIIF